MLNTSGTPRMLCVSHPTEPGLHPRLQKQHPIWEGDCTSKVKEGLVTGGRHSPDQRHKLES